MKQRIMVSVPAILLFFAALWLLDWFYTIVIAIVALIAEYEMINSTRQIGIKVFEMQLYVFATLLIPAYALFGLFGALSDPCFRFNRHADTNGVYQGKQISFFCIFYRSLAVSAVQLFVFNCID